jgi:ferritin
MNHYEEMKAKREARELERNMEYARKSDYTIDARGVVTWDSNGRVPPKDMVEAMVAMGEDICVDSCDKQRDEETAAFLADYVKAQSKRTPEEIAEQRYEARAAMGPGVEMVNVITGERYTT